VPLPGIPPWSDQDIVLYHGTLDLHVASILRCVDLNKCKHLRDFGRGFYTTTNRLQAERWANDLAAQTTGAAPAVLEFTVERNRLALLEALCFLCGARPPLWIFGVSFSFAGRQRQITAAPTHLGMISLRVQ
jgi:Protein of unknown function (DUF3990)